MTRNEEHATADESARGASYRASWEQWHRKREERLTAPHGFLSIVDLKWLGDHEETTVPSFPGSWRQDGGTVVYTPDPALAGGVAGGEGRPVEVNGLPVLSPRGYVVEAAEDAAVAIFDHGDVRAELIKRIGGTRTFAVRVRDPRSARRAAHTPTPCFEPSPDWVVPARFEPAEDKGRVVSVPASVDGLSHNEHVAGVIHVTVDGEEYPLTVFQGDDERSGIILFRDATSGVETYGGSRILAVPGLDPDTLDSLDFNHALNLPCAYTPFCTCPFAPFENRLPFAVTAGEKLPAEYHD